MMEKKTDHYRGCRIDAVVTPATEPKLHTSYKVTPETEEAKAAYRGVPGSSSETHRDLDRSGGPDPIAEAMKFTISQAKGEIDHIFMQAEKRSD